MRSASEGEMKNLGNLVKQAQRMKAEMEKIQEEAAAKRVEGTAGGGMVTVVCNGRGEMVEVKIDREVAGLDDLEMLQDLIVAAANDALRKSREVLAQEMGRLTGGLGLPPGLL
jgi:DNA-binding YbaB/EbfC family protein